MLALGNAAGGEIMKNKSGRTIWFRRYYVAGFYPSTIEGFALFSGCLAAFLGLPYGCDWLLKSSPNAGSTTWLFPVLATLGYALLPVILVTFVVISFRHMGPPD